MDIGSNSSYPAGKLSNFTPYNFIFEGVQCKSMEGLLQSFKFKNIDAQKITCCLVGVRAKSKGKKRNKEWKSTQTLWWKGVPYKRNSKEYQVLLDRAYNALYQNESFRNTLSACGDAVFTHSIGNRNSKETVLTTTEFCSRLQHLKDRGKIPIKKGDLIWNKIKRLWKKPSCV